MATVIYGNELAKELKEQLKNEISKLVENGQRAPKLTVVIVGNHPSSISYIKSKEKTCDEVGIINELISLEETVSEQELLAVIDALNRDDSVDGILVQMPLPKQINASLIVNAIDPNKDVDGFSPVNMGKLMLQEPCFHPCTAKSVMHILDEIGMHDLSGKKAVVIGRSNIVGKPLGQLLMQRHATVTTCHSRTKETAQICKEADVLVVAVGMPRLVDETYVKDGAVVIDVGINRDAEGKLCGDVDFEKVEPHASYITPVPKGVGPMTSVMLLENTLEAYRKKEGLQ